MKPKPLSARAKARIRKNQLRALRPERIAQNLAAQKLSAAAERPVAGWRASQ